MMKKIIPLFTTLLLLGWSMNAWSFACKTATGATIPIGGGSANVYVNLTPAVNVGQNLVVDLSTQIFCHNDYPETITDYVTLQRGSAYGGVLSSFSGTVKYNGTSYPFPTTTETARVIYDSRTDKPWPAVLYLTPVSTAGGVAITAGSLIAVLILHQTNNYNSDSFQFIWNIYANNDVVVPTGGCDVSARDVTVTLPDYPGSMAVPLTVHCAQSQQLGYYLSGTTADSANAIFTNTASASPAQGIGVQLTRNGQRRPGEQHGLAGHRRHLAGQPRPDGHLCPDHRPGYRRQRAVDHRHHLCLSMMTDYILSPCSLAARGLSQLMLNAAKRPVELPVEGASLRELAAVKRIVVYLPDDPLWMLTTLRQAARLLDEALPAVTDVDSEPQPGHLAVANSALSGESSGSSAQRPYCPRRSVLRGAGPSAGECAAA